ncbi:MAG: UPF0146 family protein [Haloarculaceae archaeon]
MRRRTRDALVEFLGGYDAVVEVGVGKRPDIATALSDAGVAVTATDVRERSVPTRVEFVRDDVTEPRLAVYAEAEAVYGLNLPAELQSPTVAVAERVDAACHFTTLGAEHPAVPARAATVQGETVFTAQPEPT